MKLRSEDPWIIKFNNSEIDKSMIRFRIEEVNIEDEYRNIIEVNFIDRKTNSLVSLFSDLIGTHKISIEIYSREREPIRVETFTTEFLKLEKIKENSDIVDYKICYKFTKREKEFFS